MKKIRFLLPAEIEMLEAAAYYETRVTNLGENFLATIERAVSMISEQPKTWPEIGYYAGADHDDHPCYNLSV